MGMLETREVVFVPSRWMSMSLTQLNDVIFMVDVAWHDLAALGIILLAIVADWVDGSSLWVMVSAEAHCCIPV